MKRAFALCLAALSLSACTVTVRPGASVSSPTVIPVNNSNLLLDLAPDRGEGSTYFVGDTVRFRVSTRTPGYVTLVSLDPDGYGNVLVRGAFVNAGTTVFPRAQDGQGSYQLTPPRGVQRVRAIFTSVRPTSDIVFSGRYDESGFRNTTDIYVRPYNASERDVAETFFFIR